MSFGASSQFPAYEGTEIISFQFSDPLVPASLSNEDTEVGKVWAITMRTYLDLVETGVVWWALVHGAPSKAKLVIDWKSLAGRDQFEASSHLQELSSAWKTISTTLVSRDIYGFTPSDVARETAFCSTYETVSALFTFRFKAPPSASDIEQWDASFHDLNQAIMQSPGAVVASYSIQGWNLDRTSYCAAYRYLNADTMRSFIEADDKVRRVLESLKTCASGGSELEFLETRVYKHGWQGSVDMTKPDNPALAAFISDAQALFTKDMSATMRGET